jgi:Co/Zn/Cd efflux system component
MSGEEIDLSHKSLALGGFAVLVSIIVAAAVLATSYTALQSLLSLNPVATLTAITVAIIGMVWFKKSTH